MTELLSSDGEVIALVGGRYGATLGSSGREVSLGARGPTSPTAIIRIPDELYGPYVTLHSGQHGIEWRSGSGEDARTTLTMTLDGGTIEVKLSREASALEFHLDGTLAFALFDSGVLQSSPSDREERTVPDRLERFYAVRRGAGCASLDLRRAGATTTSIVHQANNSVKLTVAFATDASTTESLIRLSVNDAAFPDFARGSSAFSNPLDERTHLIALWANQVGTLDGVDVPGSVFPTLKLPERCYWTLNTFFDPDTWSVLNCLSFSGDEYLVAEARKVIERVRAHITTDGRVPHHFDGHEPKYVAISGATQPGPNIFYCLAVLDHVAATGDHDYLRGVWADTLVPLLNALLSTFDPERNLLRSAGPLWIDVFRREGYTLDTNAMTVYLLRRMCDAAELLGDMDSAVRWSEISQRISAAIEGFWRDDHYATVLPGAGGDLDMLDSDDVLAVLAGIADDVRARTVFDRLDRTGMHPGGRGTWVSARLYGADLCYEGNIGDSSCAFARIWWAEMRARRDRGDRDGFTRMFETVRNDLLANTWMGERYDATGAMTRADGYHEYPGVLDILLREGIYGIVVDVATVDLRPMRTGDLAYRVGGIAVERAGDDWTVLVPGAGNRTFRFHDLTPGDRYLWLGGVVTVPSGGAISVNGEAGTEQELLKRSELSG